MEIIFFPNRKFRIIALSTGIQPIYPLQPHPFWQKPTGMISWCIFIRNILNTAGIKIKDIPRLPIEKIS
jgi:hypothetical protein